VSEKIDYRGRARAAVARAKEQLAGDAPGRLRYAALELRLALEALAYQTAQTFDELPESAYEKWQPDKLVKLLLELDPRADQTVRILMRTKDATGEKERDLGEDRRTPLKVLKKDFYHKLGSMLHTPTLVQIRQGKDFDEGSALKLCEEVVAEVERVLSSQIRNVRIKDLVKFECLLCKKLVIRNMPKGADSVVAYCPDHPQCLASYDIKILPGRKAEWSPRGHDVPCPKCKTEVVLFVDEIRPGITWTCQNLNCNAKVILRLGVDLDGEQESIECVP